MTNKNKAALFDICLFIMTFCILRNTGWIIFRDTASGLKSRLSVLNHSIMEAYHSSCPLKTITKSRSCPFWSSKLSDLKKRVRKLFNRAKRAWNWVECILTVYSIDIRFAKQQSFKKLCENVSSTTEAERPHISLARGKTDTLLAIKRSDGTSTSSSEKRATDSRYTALYC